MFFFSLTRTKGADISKMKDEREDKEERTVTLFFFSLRVANVGHFCTLYLLTIHQRPSGPRLSCDREMKDVADR